MSQPPERLTATDCFGRRLVLDAPPQRIVSLVPSITETLIDLGVGERLVGITTYCVHPASVVGNIPKVGATKGVAFDKIEALAPDLILANKEENRKRHIERLEELCPVFVTYPRTLEDAVQLVLDLGRLTGCDVRASEIASACSAALEAAEPSIIGPRLKTACMIWRDPWMAAGADTYMSNLLDRFGFENVFAGVAAPDTEVPPEAATVRYPETTLAAVAQRHADVVLLPSEPYAFGEADQRDVESTLAELGTTAAVVLVDGSYLTWYGTRTLPAIHYLQGVKTRLLG